MGRGRRMGRRRNKRRKVERKEDGGRERLKGERGIGWEVCTKVRVSYRGHTGIHPPSIPP